MKEFDIEAAKNGAPVQTRDGRKARIICWDKKGGYNIIALIDDNNGWGEMCAAYTDKGRAYVNDKENPMDLVMATTKHEGWVNVYKDCGELGRTSGIIYESKERAYKARGGKNKYIATVKIEWDE